MRILARVVTSAAVLLSVSGALAINTRTEEAGGLVLRSTLGSLAGGPSGVVSPVGEVKSGDMVTITGECVAEVRSADALRVVLTLADRETERPGYHALLATDQEMQGGNLTVRVPDLPDSETRIFEVRVFRLGPEAPQICEAGRIRVESSVPGKVG